MSIRASRGTRLLVAAAIAWLGLALCAQAAHATYGKVSVAKINSGGNPADTFTFHPSLTPSASDFTLKGGESSSIYSIECNIDRPGHGTECSRWGYPTLKFTEVPFPDMNAALEQKRVDGACVVEPFVSQGKAGKAKPGGKGR